MIEPNPSHFGITQEQVDTLNSQINILEAQLANPKVSGEDYTNTVGFFFAVVAWGIYVLAGNAPTTSRKVVAGIVAYFVGLIWIMLGTNYVQKLLFRARSKKAASTLANLRNSPLYEKLSKYKEAQKQYDEWLEQVEKERIKAQEEWDRWQREWSKGQAPFWLSLDGISFEVELANLYKALGYEASLTSWTGDDGVDINLKKDGRNIIVQCKAYNKPVGSPTVRELFGSLHHFQADEAILACTAGFTASAINFAKGKPIRLIKLDDILKMQASLLRNMPAPPQPRRYQSDKRSSNQTHQPSANQTTHIPAPTISRQQHIWSLAISSVAGIGIVSGCSLLAKSYSIPVLAPEKKIAALSTPTPIPPTPTPKPSSTPQPTPSASKEEEDIADVVDTPESENLPSITLTLPSPTPIPTINQNSTDISRSNSNFGSNQSNSNLQTPTPLLPPQPLSRDDERRISKANSLKQLGVDVDWREYTWTELYDMEMRVRKATDLQRLGLNVDWRKYTWAEMYDWQQRIQKAEDLKTMGLNVDWHEHTWAEMYDWQQRIRKVNDLQKYGIYIDWHNYTWLQMYEMEQKARKK